MFWGLFINSAEEVLFYWPLVCRSVLLRLRNNDWANLLEGCSVEWTKESIAF